MPVRDIQIHPRDNDLIVATHGRGIYILDDVTPLQKMAAALSTDAQLFDVRPATRWTVWNKDGNLGQKRLERTRIRRPARILNYYLKNDADVVITIADKAGKAIRTIRNAPHAAGLNRVVWDLRYDGATGAGGRPRPAARSGPRRRDSPPAPQAAPAEEVPAAGRGGAAAAADRSSSRATTRSRCAPAARS